jgi:hypothetical protein
MRDSSGKPRVCCEGYARGKRGLATNSPTVKETQSVFLHGHAQ